MKQLKHLCFGIIFLMLTATSFSQGLLNSSISLQVNRQRLDNVLEIISNKGDFYFSYNSSIIKKDSIVSFSYTNKTIKTILNDVFGNGYEFRESGNYIIIRKAPIKVTLVTQKMEIKDKSYTVSGYVYDEASGGAISEASIYEKKILASAFTNDIGFFKIKLKTSKASSAELTVSKAFYEDTTVAIQTNRNQQLTVTLNPIENPINIVNVSPKDYLIPDSIRAIKAVPVMLAQTEMYDTNKVEKLGLSKLFLSAKQRVQSINLKDFFTKRSYQVSVIPKLSTHGYLSGQVINNFSLNIFGGYTAGTRGAEIGGFFNIDKLNMLGVQASGLFNMVGGKVKGFQVAGLSNTVLDSVIAFQAAGIVNTVKGKFTGFQVGGIYNHVTDSVRGFQVAGIANFVNKKVTGLQIAGIANISRKETQGVQIAGIINYSKKISGVQIGLINIADSSDGYSIGLINIVLKGYHKLSISTNELIDMNVAFKTGNPKFYSILMAGMNLNTNNKLYSFGYGLGSEQVLNKRKTLSFNPEVSCQSLYAGSWDYTNILGKLSLNLNVKLNKYISLFAGPSYNVYVSDQPIGFTGYRFPVVTSSAHRYGNDVHGWLGWNAGINIF